MSKVKILLVVISVILLMGAGCELSKKSTDSGGTVDYSGVEGLSVVFIDGMPPQKVWKDIEFNVAVDVQNNGLTDVSQGLVCFSSMSSNVFSKADQCSVLEEDGSLIGRISFPDGEIRTYIWEDYKLTQSYRKESFYPLTAKVCYAEETLASPTVCVKSVGEEGEDVCEAGEIVLGEGGSNSKGKIFLKSNKLGGKGQGAPLAVTSIYEDIVPRQEQNELIFTIGVANLGEGEIIDLNKLNKEDCNFKRLDKNKVKIEAELVGYPGGKCINNGIITLDVNGQGQTLCRGFLVPKEASFPLPLNIKLDYGYLSTASGGFTIQKDIGAYEEA